MDNSLTASEKFFFETNGYVILESFLSERFVVQLREALQQAISGRLQLKNNGTSHYAIPGQHYEGSDRIFYLLDEDPLFLKLMNFPPVMPYIREILNQESPHFHASDGFWEEGQQNLEPAWHIDGPDNGFRNLRPRIPMLELKVGYFLSDMSEKDQGNLMVVPGSHRTDREPEEIALTGFNSFPGAIQLCCPVGSCVLFHNALWHTRGPLTRPGGRRILLYYAYEHPWMIGSPEHTAYPARFYRDLSAEQRNMFHSFLFRDKVETS